MSVQFQDAAGHDIGDAHIGPVTDLTRRGKTGLVTSQTIGTVPKGARKAVITILMVRTDGAYNDGYADDISLVIS